MKIPRLYLVQENPKVGDFEGNTALILKYFREAEKKAADIVVFPELFLSGYPCDDAWVLPHFMQKCAFFIKKIADFTKNSKTSLLFGAPFVENSSLYNGAVFIENGGIQHIIFKKMLPNTGVFDEKRHFAEGAEIKPLIFKGCKIGVMICEDMWSPTVAETLADQGAQCLLVINASPYEREKFSSRLEHARARVNKTGLPLFYLNLWGGQDEIIFDGQSFGLDARGDFIFRLPAWTSATVLVPEDQPLIPPLDKSEEVYQGLVTGLRDYIHKNGFSDVVLGLSGGIDSALVACIAVDALGLDHVHPVMLPTQFTSSESTEDSQHLCDNLKLRLMTLPMHHSVQAIADTLSAAGHPPQGLSGENIQSRLRAVVLMALSNTKGWLLLSTGNKSELAVGYATLYGDMCGAYNPLKDVYKTRVYELAAWVNRTQVVIPKRIITKAPTAELRENQTDQDSLPPYEVLDAVLEDLIENQLSSLEIIDKGFPKETVQQVAQLFKNSEYKRFQSPPGPKITSKAFGRDRRMPLTNGYGY